MTQLLRWLQMEYLCIGEHYVPEEHISDDTFRILNGMINEKILIELLIFIASFARKDVNTIAVVEDIIDVR